MSFFFNFFKSGSRVTTSGNGTNITISEGTKYANWNREKLIKRIIELESEETNEHLSSKKRKGDEVNYTDDVSSQKSNKRVKKKDRKFDFSKYNTRFIALRFAYLGWNYNGLAIQKDATKLPTVEGTILEAMNKCKLVPSMIPQDYKFSRCGRTDKGVSAMNQVISLNVRSNLTDEEQKVPSNDSKEIEYVNLLNQLLPDDIRISAVALRPPEGFDARFSCRSRHYKYLFDKNDLNIEKMKEAAKLFEGEHDFRNFCKIDGSKQITNYKRAIISADILKVTDDFYCFDLIGTAFLWHQVRCMMANLFLVGQGLEEPSLISNMLDVENLPQKPIYEMASDIPLLLYDCEFDSNIEWKESDVNNYKSNKYSKAVDALKLDYELKATITKIFKDALPSKEFHSQGKTRINLGDGFGKVITHYQKILDRDVMAPVDVVNEKFRKRKQNKKNKE